MTTDEEILASYMKAHARKGIDKDGLTHHDDDGFPTTRTRVYELMKLAREDVFANFKGIDDFYKMKERAEKAEAHLAKLKRIQPEISNAMIVRLTEEQCGKLNAFIKEKKEKISRLENDLKHAVNCDGYEHIGDEKENCPICLKIIEDQEERLQAEDSEGNHVRRMS